MNMVMQRVIKEYFGFIREHYFSLFLILNEHTFETEIFAFLFFTESTFDAEIFVSPI